MIYLDHAAHTPLDPAVGEAMRSADRLGNPHNLSHAPGRCAAAAIERARHEVAACIGAAADGLLFTSGATESNNLAIFGSLRPGDTLAVSAIEHPSVLRAATEWARRGHPLIELPVDRNGRIRVDALREALEQRPRLVSIMWVNNEIGTIQDMEAIANLAHDYGAWVHCDASQAVGRVAVQAELVGVDLLTLSGHKLYGPHGIGALWIRDGLPIRPQLFGGDQQYGLRPGTLNTPGIVGLGAACRAATEPLPTRHARARALGGWVREQLCARLDGCRLTVPEGLNVPEIVHCTLPHVETETLLSMLSGVALSTGSACHGGHVTPSHVLTAVSTERDRVLGGLRLSFGKDTTSDDLDQALLELTDAYRFLREATCQTNRQPLTATVGAPS